MSRPEDFQVQDGVLTQYTGTDGEAAIPEGVTRIAAGAFAGQAGLTRVVFPESLETVEDGAFDGCAAWTEAKAVHDMSQIAGKGFGGVSVSFRERNGVHTDVTIHSVHGYQGWTCEYKSEKGCLAVRDGALFSPDGVLLHLLDNVQGPYAVPEGTKEIGRYAFTRRKGLTAVTFPESVTAIRDNAFSGCSRLAGLVLPGALKTLEERAFSGCAGLTELTLPGTLKTVGKEAFSDCAGLTRVTVSPGVKELENAAFGSCAALTEVTLGDGLVSVSNRTFAGCSALRSVSLPASIRKLYVVSGYTGGDERLYKAMPEGLLRREGAIDSGLFKHLEEYWKDQITDEDCPWVFLFQTNKKLLALCQKRVKPPYDGYVAAMADILQDHGTAKHMEKAAAFVRENQTKVGPEAVQALYDTAAAREDKRVQDMLAPLLNGGDPDDIRLQFDMEGTTLRGYNGPGGEVVVPENITAIGDGAFQECKTLTAVTLPEKLKSIGKNAFRGCTSLTAIRIPAKIKTIPSGAFQYCTKLAKVELPEGLTAIQQNAFSHCDALTALELPQSLKSLSRGAFANSGLKRVALPEKVASLDYGVFSYTGLDELFAPGVKSAYKVDKYACEGVKVLILPNVWLSCLPTTNYKYSAVLGLAKWLGHGGKVDGAVRKDAVQYLRSQRSRFYDEALKNADLLALLTQEKLIPKTAMRILLDKAVAGGRAEITAMLLEYQNANFGQPDPEKELQKKMKALERSLETGAMPLAEFKQSWRSRKLKGKTLEIAAYTGSEAHVTAPSIVGKTAVTSIGTSAFASRKTLTHVTLPDGVTAIKDAAFFRCSALTQIDLPQGLETIGERAFEGCSSLREITLPDKIKHLDAGMFQNCAALERVILPNGLQSLSGEGDWGGYAFRGCTALKEIRIPAGIQDVEGNTFDGCTALTAWDVDPANKHLRAEGPLLLSADGRTLFRCLPGFAGAVDVPEGVTKIAESAFNSCVHLTAVTIPAGVMALESEAFQGCAALERVDLPENMGAIGWSCFRGCTSLTEIVLPDGVREIASSAFKGCTALKRAVLPESVDSIGSYCFRDCTALTELVLPKMCKDVGNDAFHGCAALTEVVFPAGVEYLCQWVFKDCKALKRVRFLGDRIALHDDSFEGCKKLGRLDLPGDLSWTSPKAFKALKALPKLVIHAPAGSQTETAAQDYGIPFVPSEE